MFLLVHNFRLGLKHLPNFVTCFEPIFIQSIHIFYYRNNFFWKKHLNDQTCKREKSTQNQLVCHKVYLNISTK